jgi:DNA repair exonuclease SbcCD ATPase subunit
MELKIKRLEVEGFRAFPGKLSIEFDDRLTVIYGPAGAGKTSIVRALEFVLFGETREVNARLMRKEDLVNDFCEKARVAVVLDDGRDGFLVERVLTKSGASRLKVVSGTSELYDDLAEQYIQSKLALLQEDFNWEIAVGYQELQALVHASSSLRDRILDGLLGLTDVRRLYRELSGKELKGYLKALRDELAKLGGDSLLSRYEELKTRYRQVVVERDALVSELEQLEARRRLLDEERASLQARAREASALIEERGRLQAFLQSLGDEKLARMPALDENYVREYAEKFKKEVSEALEFFYMVREAEFLKGLDSANLSELLKASKELMDKMKNYTIKMEYEIKDINNEIKRLENYINDLEDELAELESKIDELEQSKSEYDMLVSKFGDSANVAKRIAQIEVEMKALQSEESRMRCARDLQESMLRQIMDQGTAICPVCGSAITDAEALPKVEPVEAIRLKREKLERTLYDLREVERKLRRLEPELRLLDDYESRKDSLSSALDERLEELHELRASAEELEERLREAKRRVTGLLRAYEQLDSYYKRLRYTELQEKLKKIEAEIRELGYDESKLSRVTNEINGLDRKISNIKGRLSELENMERQLSEEIYRLEVNIENLKNIKTREEKVSNLYRSLMAVRAALLDAHVSLRQKFTRRLSEAASRIFARLETSGEYNAVDIEVQSTGSRGRRGHYVFRVRRKLDGSYVSAFTRLSDGQRSIMALSILLALRQLKPRNLNVLILDDAAPNVDEETKLALARFLAEDFSSAFQVILTTQSRRVAEELRSVAKVYSLEAIKKVPGTSAETTSVESQERV